MLALRPSKELPWEDAHDEGAVPLQQTKLEDLSHPQRCLGRRGSLRRRRALQGSSLEGHEIDWG